MSAHPAERCDECIDGATCEECGATRVHRVEDYWEPSTDFETDFAEPGYLEGYDYCTACGSKEIAHTEPT
jgi:hypothetical protein